MDESHSLERNKVKLAALERKISEAKASHLLSLPEKHGYSSMKEFLKALRRASKVAPKRRTRAIVTDDTRGRVKQMSAKGKTGLEMASALGISLPTVQNIKKALGLVTPRKKRK